MPSQRISLATQKRVETLRELYKTADSLAAQVYPRQNYADLTTATASIDLIIAWGLNLAIEKLNRDIERHRATLAARVAHVDVVG